MNEQATLKAVPRTEVGSGPAGRLRREGWIPAVIYGHGEEARTLKVEERELRQLLERISVDNTLVDLSLEGEGTEKVLIREVQTHPWKSQLLHVDFFHIREDEEIRVAVPLHFEGVPVGVKDGGGILQTTLNQLEIECLPSEIPEYFEVDVSGLEIGDSLHVADIGTGGVRPLEEPDMTLCVVVPPTVITVEEEEEEVELELEELEAGLPGEEKAEAEEEETGASEAGREEG